MLTSVDVISSTPADVSVDPHAAVRSDDRAAGFSLARALEHGTIVVLFADFGDRYLSTNLWLGWQRLQGTLP